MPHSFLVWTKLPIIYLEWTSRANPQIW